VNPEGEALGVRAVKKLMFHPTLLSIRQASKSYSGVPALINADLDLRAGEVHALMGENGAGKSTLIKLLAGVVTPDRMAVEINGQPVTISSAASAFKHGLRFIHQELQVIPQVSVAENIFLGQPYPSWFGVQVRWRQLHALAGQALAKLGIDHISPSATMARLSPGDQMLVNITRAFVGDDIGGETSTALVYVMDEPTAALTGTEITQLFRVIWRLRERGCAVLYVSHRMDEIFQIANRVTVMRDGRVVDTRSISDVTPTDLILMMTGRALEQVYPPRTALPSERVLLDVRGLHTHHINDVSFRLHAGEIVGVAGLNGAGRTELLRALMGIDRLRAGEIALEGQSLRRHSPARAWNAQIAYVPEERRSQGLVLSRSIADNVTLPQLRHISHFGAVLAHGRERQTSLQLGEAVRLRARGVTQTTRELSGGNQQKVVFARALARSPRVLLLDEPTRGVDVGAKADIYGIIREMSARGIGILLVSSDLPELLGMTDRVLVMRAGRLVETLPTAGLTQDILLTCCYGELEHVGARHR
jgi:ribose transport system ATP-binding protein